jgi:2-polyprenyl-6-methoxyphenol hydroxylase-like FAD-dependent oxidoreductase
MATPGHNRIAIIGAGPSGLTLARILHINSIPVTVFEYDSSPAARSQGGSLDLHPKSGQQALKEANLFTEFEKHCRYEGEDFILTDKHGNKHVEVTDTETGRPEIDRIELRQILIESLPEGIIQWGKPVKSVEIGSITFTNGEVQKGWDLIVGADGAWSKVRHLLTTVTPFYSGISGIDLRLAKLEERHPDLSALVGKGSFFAFGEEDKRVMLMQRNANGVLRNYCFGAKPESWIKGTNIDFKDQQAVKKMLLQDYGHWAPNLKRFIDVLDAEAGDEIIARALYMLPVGLTWPNNPGVTLIGDAAHLMTPFAGEGVNMAMQDALELALTIIAGPNDLVHAVKTYEKDMFPRAREVTQKTWDSLQTRFAPGGIRQFKGRINKMLSQLPDDKVEVMLSRIKISED